MEFPQDRPLHDPVRGQVPHVGIASDARSHAVAFEDGGSSPSSRTLRRAGAQANYASGRSLPRHAAIPLSIRCEPSLPAVRPLALITVLLGDPEMGVAGR